MPVFQLCAVAVALALDAFSVAVATGVCLRRVSVRQNFRLSWHFGLFQALMPVAGWFAGLSFRVYIEAWDHWVAFVLLACVGLNMIRQALRAPEDACPAADPTRGLSLVMLSLATSIDALAVGLSIAVIGGAIFIPALVIGLVAAGFTLIGLQLGQRLGRLSRLSRYAEMTGGLVLLAIGVKILHAHGALMFV